MGKSTTFIGQPVLNQIMNLMNRDKINIMAAKDGVNRYTKQLDAYTHLVIMLYAVLTGAESIREVVLGFDVNAHRLARLGLAYTVRRSTLSDANKRRSESFFGHIYKSLYARYSSLLSDSLTKREVLERLYIMDSTTTSLFSQVLKGVGRNPKNGKKKGGFKAHTVIKFDSDPPDFIDMTAAAVHDRQKMDCLLKLPAGSYVAFDKGYTDYYEWQQLTEANIKYVTRMKDNAKFTIREWRSVRDLPGIDSDQVIELSYTKKTMRELPEEELKHRRGRKPKDGKVMVTEYKTGVHKCRRIMKKSEKTGDYITFITNDFDLPADQICEIYRRRWTIETLYKRSKQNFPLKYFLGNNENEIKIQIWVTMIAYLLMRVLQKKSRSKLAFSNIVTVVRITICSYMNIITLIANPRVEWQALQKKLREEMEKQKQKELQLSLFPGW